MAIGISPRFPFDKLRVRVEISESVSFSTQSTVLHHSQALTLESSGA